MKGLREIKGRIKAVKNTAQITKAMQLVAASKMKRAQDNALAKRPYSLLLTEILESVAPKLEGLKHPLLEKRTINKRGVLVVATDKGLCGALNSNLFRSILAMREEARFVAIGRKATQYLSLASCELLADFTVKDSVPFQEVRMVVEYMMKLYEDGEIDTIEVLFPSFKNTLVQEPILETLVPFGSLTEGLKALRKRHGVEEKPHAEDNREMLFEPTVQAILDELPTLFVKHEIYYRILEAKASEHSARMVAMKTATDNANNLIDDLTLEYNKARQANITQEILEISAASMAS
tara:strand:+ start:92948 stop:93826 length:879 start_codon:yes stop_codon:yes gene_type:complete